MLRVTPIYGSTGHHPASKSIALPPSCTLIEYGGIRLLVNVGHDESSSVGATSNANGSVADFVSSSNSNSNSSGVDLPEVDAVLITDSSLQSLGGLPYYYGQDSSSRRNRNVNVNSSHNNNNSSRQSPTQIYATFPTIKMGQMNLYDHHANISLDGANPGYSLQDIDSLFTTSKYYQQSNTHQSDSNTNSNTNSNSNNINNAVSKSQDDTNNNGNNTNTNNNNTNTNNNNNPTATIQTLKYAQTVIINDTQNNHKPAISITPHKAGHLVGASYYILKRLVDETEVIVAPIYHHAKEKHLDSSTLYKYGTACDVLITCCGGPGGLLRELYSPLPKNTCKSITTTNTNNNHNNNNNANANAYTNNSRSNWKNTNTIIKRKLNPPSVLRDEGDLVETVLSTLRRGGNVLLPVDASGRVLELVLLLNQHWEKHRLGSAYNLCWVGSMVQNTIAFAKSQLEWMAKPLGAQFDTGRGHPYSLKNMQLFSSMNELELSFPDLFGMNDDLDTGGGGIGGIGMKSGSDRNNTNTNPTCILASGATLDCGPARDLFLKWCENGDNTILLTDSRRCVLRGDVVSQRKKKEKELMLKTNKGKKGMDGSSSIATTDIVGGSSATRTVGANVSVGVGANVGANVGVMGSINDSGVVSDTDSITPTTTRTIDDTTSTTSTNTPDTPNIVQEDEEVTGVTTLNIGSLITYSDLSDFSTAGQLLLKWCEAKAADVEMEDVVECDVLVPKRSALAGVELQSFIEREELMRRKEKAEEERLAMLREVELAKGRLRLNEVNDEPTTTSTSTSSSKAGSGGADSNDSSSSKSKHPSADSKEKSSLARPKKKSRFDANLFMKFSKPCHMTFEVREEAVGIGQPDSIAKYGIGESIGQGGDVIEDDYGIAVKPERFFDVGIGYSSEYKNNKNGISGDDVHKRVGLDGRPLLASSRAMSSTDMGEHGRDDIGGQTLEDEEMALEAGDLSEGNGIIRGRNNRPPVKVSTEPRRIEVLAEIAFIPLEGRVDAIVARQSVRALQPRQVVILGGGKPVDEVMGDNDVEMKDSNKESSIEGEAALLADAVRSLALGDRGSIFAPTDGETTELSVGHAAYSVRLIDTPYMTREEREALEEEGIEVPSVETHEAKVGECTVGLMNCVATGQRVAADGSIVLAPRRFPDSNQHSAVMLSDGDVLLTDLRSEVIAQGMKAEYSRHVGYAQLVVNGKIVVRKDQATGEINVEGPLCEDFFLVRTTVCKQYVSI